MASHPKHNYATLSTPGTKKISVCARRVGSRERMSVIAVCTDETNAEKIVDGLNMLRGALTKLEVPAQHVLEEVRARLASAEATNRTQAIKVRDLENKERAIARDLANVTDQLHKAKRNLAAARPTPA